MGEIDDACRDVVANVDGAVVCGIVDLDSGLLLGSHVSSLFPPGISEAVSALAVELFREPTRGRVERIVRSRRSPNEGDGPGIEEVHATSRDAFHFARTIKNGRVALILITKRTANQGIGWAQIKGAIPKIEAHLP